MNPDYRSAAVYVRGRRAGVISETDEGYCFAYDEDYVRNGLVPLSLTISCSGAILIGSRVQM